MAGRKVTIKLSSTCDSPIVHQPIYVRLSSGEAWIPPDKRPLRFPPKGSPDEKNPSPEVNVKDVADALQTAVTQAQIVGGARVSQVSPVTRHDWRDPETGATKGTTDVFAFSFVTEDDEIDYSITGVKFSKGKEVAEGSQIKMCVLVGEGDEELYVKPVPAQATVTHANSPADPPSPGEVVRPPNRKRVRPKKRGKFGDDLEGPEDRTLAMAWWDRFGTQAAYWDAEDEVQHSWAMRMSVPPESESVGLRQFPIEPEDAPSLLPGPPANPRAFLPE